MKVVFPGIEKVFEIEMDYVNTLVIENQSLFHCVLKDLQDQIDGFEGKTVVSDKEKILSVAKDVEVISQFVPFRLSKRILINKIIATLEQKAIQETYARTMELLSMIESYLMNLTFEVSGNIEFTTLSIESILKAVGVKICEDYDSLGEKLIDYMELVTEYCGEKLFVFVNLRSYISDHEAQLLIDTTLLHRYRILMIEGHESRKLNGEKRFLVDSDYCEIQ